MCCVYFKTLTCYRHSWQIQTIIFLSISINPAWKTKSYYCLPVPSQLWEEGGEPDLTFLSAYLCLFLPLFFLCVFLYEALCGLDHQIKSSISMLLLQYHSHRLCLRRCLAGLHGFSSLGLASFLPAFHVAWSWYISFTNRKENKNYIIVNIVESLALMKGKASDGRSDMALPRWCIFCRHIMESTCLFGNKLVSWGGGGGKLVVLPSGATGRASICILGVEIHSVTDPSCSSRVLWGHAGSVQASSPRILNLSGKP